MLETNPDPHLTIVATGSEVQLAIDAANELKTDSIKANVVSMPSLDIFMQQKEDFQNSIIDPDKPILVVE